MMRLGWTHTWLDRKNDNRWSCHGLRDAFLHYRWNGEAWAGTKIALDAFRCELREAVKTEDVGRVVTVCENILKWGGVAAHNVRYLHRQQPVLVRELQHVRDLLSRHCTPSKHDLRREPDNPATECRMNAGFVKIYSLLCDDCVIYDGRVGAALGLLTRQFCEATGRTAVPPCWRSPSARRRRHRTRQTPRCATRVTAPCGFRGCGRMPDSTPFR